MHKLFNGLKGVLLALAALLAMASPALAQIRQPVKWTVESKKVKKNVYDITATGSIRSGWHIYDLQDSEMGPNPTIFSISGEAIEAEGKPQITSPVNRFYDEIFEMEIGTCDGPVTIVQRVHTLQEGPCDVNVHIEWQACNEGNCLPPDEFDATVQVEGAAAGSAGSIWALILEAILWGFLMLLTPCVFPMVPMTVSFFLKQSDTPAKGRFNALMYGIFIVLLYTIPICVIIGLTWAIGGSTVTADIFN